MLDPETELLFAKKLKELADLKEIVQKRIDNFEQAGLKVEMRDHAAFKSIEAQENMLAQELNRITNFIKYLKGKNNGILQRT